MSKQFSMDDYIDVAERIGEFRSKHPEGSLQQVSVDFREVNGGWWVVYTAAAYRSPDDLRPGHGTAWEPIPGKTPYTRDSELQNAETAAWGRAIVAVLAADTKRGVASAQEVQARRYDAKPDPLTAAKVRLAEVAGPRVPQGAQLGPWLRAQFAERGLNPDDAADVQKLTDEWSQP